VHLPQKSTGTIATNDPKVMIGMHSGAVGLLGDQASKQAPHFSNTACKEDYTENKFYLPSIDKIIPLDDI
jgi:hypothetical protein